MNGFYACRLTEAAPDTNYNFPLRSSFTRPSKITAGLVADTPVLSLGRNLHFFFLEKS
jgi:hypothetical protein